MKFFKAVRGMLKMAPKVDVLLWIVAPVYLIVALAISGRWDMVLLAAMALFAGLRWLLDQPEVHLTKTIMGMLNDFETVHVERFDETTIAFHAMHARHPES